MPISADEGGALWLCRILNWTSGGQWDATGDMYECVDLYKDYMFGESGGAFKMEKPNTDAYIEDVGGFPVTGVNSYTSRT